MQSVVDAVIKEKEYRNERRVALIRFIAMCPMTIYDTLAYFGYVSFSEGQPSLLTLGLDYFFVTSGATFLFLLTKGFHPSYLKYIILSIDYTFLVVSILFDPTVPKTGDLGIWSTLVGALFFFWINLLRYSREATLYAMFLSLIIYWSVVLYLDAFSKTDVIPMFSVLCILLFIGYTLTNTSKRMMLEASTKQMMERYLPPELVGELYKKNTSLEPGGHNQRVCILFADIRSFTSISESMPAKSVVSFLNHYLSAMTDIIFQHKGTIDKFIGDAIMTIFGAPIPADDDSERAVQCAIAMQRGLVQFNQEQKQNIRIGIGIHTGEAIVGNIGSAKRLDYTVIGDSVNLSSRIQDLTKHYHCPILISDATKQELKDDSSSYLIREVDTVVVKGKSQSVVIYQIIDFTSAADKESKQEFVKAFHTALQRYKNQQFPEAGELFAALKTEDPLTGLYQERCEYLQQNPPEDNWDGSFMMREK
ncbi:MAG: adenylate/guanylate cyclase domain-containing protein [Spirochaetota bacterium]